MLSQNCGPEEPLLTIKQIAGALGLQYWKVQRAVKCGELTSYQLGNKRRLLRLSEVKATINETRRGGER